MHVTIEMQAAYAEGLLPAAEARRVHAHLLRCPVCAQGMVDQLSVRQSLASMVLPPSPHDGWPALARSLGQDWQEDRRDQTPPAPRAWRGQRSRWAAAALITIGLTGGMWITGLQPPTSDGDDVDSFWREHHTFTSRSMVSGRILSSFRSIQSTHRMNRSLP